MKKFVCNNELYKKGPGIWSLSEYRNGFVGGWVSRLQVFSRRKSESRPNLADLKRTSNQGWKIEIEDIPCKILRS